MSPIERILIIIAKIIRNFIRFFGSGNGGTWPGEFTLWFQPNIIDSFAKPQITSIVVAGTNGKTTTVKMLETILKTAGFKVCHNDSGANLENGIVSTFIKDANWSGNLKSKIFLFEIDEGALPKIVKKLQPRIIVLNNLFRDQLDRYGEVDAIAEKWQKALTYLPNNTQFIINADDPELVYIGKQLKGDVIYYGLEEPKLYLPRIQHATDTIYCPKCGHRLTFAGVYFSHLGKWTCGKCGLTHPDIKISVADYDSPLEGVYNKYNTLAAASAATLLKIPRSTIEQSLQEFKPAFGRMEEINHSGKKIKILLSKNPTGFNESLRTYLNSDQKGPLLLVLNDRIPDGTDVSWIWDVDFELLADNPDINKNIQDLPRIVASGERCFDMGLRLKYAGLNQNIDFMIIPILPEAINSGVNQTQSMETLWILATYTSMLEVRKILTGKKIL
jgi:lipid II isoglutaminyl synthase (glutamine-hydrolysing)